MGSPRELSPLGLGGYLLGLGVGATGLIVLANARCAAFNTSGHGFESGCAAPDVTPYFAAAAVVVAIGAALSLFVLVRRLRSAA